jgi:S-adenosylmethionine hydrolase
MPNLPRFGILGAIAIVLAMSGVSSSTAHASPTAVIGLVTDYGGEDSYVAQLKGAILTIDPEARILDLLHSVTPFNVTEGSYLLDQCADGFPAGTIFVAVVDPGVGTERDPILLETAQGKFFVGPDNGLFTLVVAHEGFSRAWKLDQPAFFRAGGASRTFDGRDIFGPVAAHLAAGVDPERLGTPVKTLVLLPYKEPAFSDGLICTEVLHIDHFGNVILNLPGGGDLAAKLKEGNLVKISIGRESYSAPLVRTYGEVQKGRLLLLYGGAGLLEIGMNQGSAARQLKVEPGASVFLKP